MEKQSAAFPRPANSVSHNSMSKAVIHITTNPNLGEIQTFYGKADKFSFCRIKSLDFILYIFWIYYHRMQEVIS